MLRGKPFCLMIPDLICHVPPVARNWKLWTIHELGSVGMIWLERHDDEVNMHRFYALEISQDLFGVWLLIRRWGRIGRGDGQVIVSSYDTLKAAVMARDALLKAKSNRNYA